MRLPFLLLLTACSGGVLAQQAPRVPLEDTGATVEHPNGWTLMPASGSPPVVMFHLCDPSLSDGCLVKGEMAMNAPNPDLDAPPLEPSLDGAERTGAISQPMPRLTKSGDFVALETRWVNAESPVRHASAGATMLIDTPQGRFSCSLMMEPGRVEGMLDTWRRFCASLIPVGSMPDAERHG